MHLPDSSGHAKKQPESLGALYASLQKGECCARKNVDGTTRPVLIGCRTHPAAT